MAYVDLNPIRAKMAETLEKSDHTSIKQRITQAKEGKQPKQLLRFAGMPRQIMPTGLPFELTSHLELVELTGRVYEKASEDILKVHTCLYSKESIFPEKTS